MLLDPGRFLPLTQGILKRGHFRTPRSVEVTVLIKPCVLPFPTTVPHPGDAGVRADSCPPEANGLVAEKGKEIPTGVYVGVEAPTA